MDVVVAGIGIAGAFALRRLSRSLDVIGIDKREKLGYPVECGEIIPTKREMKTLLPDLYDYSLFDIPKLFESNRTKEVHFVLPNGKVFEIEFEFHVVRRDEMIQKIAEESGHRILLKTRIKGLRGSRLVTDSGELDAKVIVAADGANSRIAKDLGVWKYEIAAAKQYVMKGVECEEDVVYMFVGRKIAPGAYGWIIPKGDGYANVGIGFRKKFSSGSVSEALKKFVREYEYSSQYLKNAEVVSKISAIVPIDKPLDKAVYGNVLLVGDAASMIISHVGGGIPISMVAGDLAAKVVNDYFEGGELDKYDLLWQKYLLAPLMRAYYLRRLWDKFSNDDEKMSKILGLASDKDMAAILRCRVPLKVRLLSAFLPIVDKIIR